jgi:hypothetical protein
MKSYSTHKRVLLGPLQIVGIFVKAPAEARVELWGKDPERPLAKIEGSGQWRPSLEKGPIILEVDNYCGFTVEPETAEVKIQTLYEPT